MTITLRGDKQCPHGHTARRKCDTCDREDDQAEIAQLRGNLSLAEEGLANYAQENERLKSALQKIAAYDPGKFRPLEDEIAIWRLSTEALSESSREPQSGDAPQHK